MRDLPIVRFPLPLALLFPLGLATGAEPVTVLPAEVTPAVAAAPAPIKLPARFDTRRADIRAFVEQASSRHGFKAADLLALIAQAKPQGSILDAMNRPAEKVTPWWQYRERFLTETRIANGAKFWDEHDTLLRRVARERGVAPEYIVAILGVETQYGRGMGRYRVLDALTTLGFEHPTRGEYFRRELEQFLLMGREKDADPLTALGSYAGAMGAAQFMPSSYRNYAIDSDGKGYADLWKDWGDIFNSIANYFTEHGWETGGPVMTDAHGASEQDDPLSFRLELADTLGAIRARGYRVDSRAAESVKAVLVPAEQADSMSWRVGFQNFYVITRYNRSTRYAMAVHDLAQAIVERRRGTAAAAEPT